MIHFSKHHSWLDVERFAKSHDHDWTYIIIGRIGPTGKTHLYQKLHENGYNVIEPAEDLFMLIDYSDNENHYLVYEENKIMIIILNRRLNHERT